jgi:hypothetical protein
MKKSLLFCLLLSGFFVAAQEDDAYKKFIKSSSVAIHKAQKQMIRYQNTDAGGLLAKAVILQNNALLLYKVNDNPRAVCASATARKYAAELIKKLDGKVSDFYLIHEDEKTLLTHCANDNELFSESKRTADNPSELDKDYLNSFNNLTIDFNLN